MKAKLKLGGKYTIGRKLGAGAFGEVYVAKDNATNEEVAIKVENSKATHPQLIYEAKLIKQLKGKGIPELKAVLVEGDYNIMIMQLLNASLESLFSKLK